MTDASQLKSYIKILLLPPLPYSKYVDEVKREMIDEKLVIKNIVNKFPDCHLDDVKYYLNQEIGFQFQLTYQEPLNPEKDVDKRNEMLQYCLFNINHNFV